MTSPWDLLAFVLVMALATQITRFLPFVIPARWLEGRRVSLLKAGLPGVILLLLVVYSLKDTAVTVAPWGLNEALALALVLGLHAWRRNALLSISLGTALYMVLVQTGLLARLGGGPW